MENSILRSIVRGAYDEQKLRIMMGNRLVGNFKVKLGLPPSTKENEMDSQGKKILLDLRASYKKLTDGVKTFPRESSFLGDGIISSYSELSLVAQYIQLEKDEEQHFIRLGNIINPHPIWITFLKDVKGVGPAMAGVILSEIDIYKAKYPSSLWKYAGLDVVEGQGRSRKEHHLVKVKYTNKKGEEQERNSITFNPFLKTKMFVLASSFLRSGGPYANIYYNYKNRLENHPSHIEKTKLHRHNMALRYMLKIFLIDLHVAWRPLEGLSIEAPYHEAKLGIYHHRTERAA